jgi:alkyl sulfatase BDS1-like metallo-beta-lactamase superfamily hydrolase
MLVTGRNEPIVGAELIEACLERLHDAVTYVHEETLKGFNAGVDVWTLMEKIQLPPELRVGQGYGKVSWAVRTFWEEYVGWFKLESTTEFYPDSAPAALAELLALTGTDAALDRAEAALARGNAPLAIKLGEAIAQVEPENVRLRALMAGAHQYLIDNGGDESFWESGWLRTERARWSEEV